MTLRSKFKKSPQICRYESTLNIISVTLACLAGFVFYTVTTYSAVNIPNADDFDIYLAFLNAFTMEDSTWRKVTLLLERHNEHFVVLARTGALLCYYVVGQIDFKYLIAAGNASIVGLVLLMYFVWQQRRPCASTNPAFFLPVPLLLFQPQYAEATQWASAALQFSCAPLLALGAISLSLSYDRHQNLYGAGLAVLACFTQANGLLLFAVIALLLLKQGRRAAGTAHVFIFTSAMAAQFKNYAPTPVFPLAHLDLIRIADYCLSLLGSAFAFDNHSWALSGGIAVALAFSIATCRLKAQSDALYGFFLFLILSAAAAAFSRAAAGTAIAYTTGRYTLVSLLCMGVAYLSLMDSLHNSTQKQILALFVCSITLAYLPYSYGRNLPQITLRQQLLNDSMIRWAVAGTGLAYPNAARATEIFRHSIASKIFTPPKIKIDQLKSVEAALEIPRLTAPTNLSIEHVVVGERWVVIDGYCFLLKGSTSQPRIWLALRSDRTSYVFESNLRIRPDVTQHIRRLSLLPSQINLDNSGYIAVIDKSQLLPATYKIGVIISAGKVRSFHESSQVLTVHSQR